MTVSSETIARWQASFEGTMIGLVGFTIVSASREKVVAEMPYGAHLRQVTGLFHAGAILTLADSTATALANLHTQASADDFDPACFPLTVQLSANFIRNAQTDKLVATAVPVHIGRRTLVVRTDVCDADGRLFATATNTLVPAGQSGSTLPSEGADS
ncbi:MAG: PaaI family thioesterase [Dehalococcoidia bacterium]|nr:PaaI family thioesterase [Dehalococcoidia bacterium]